MSKILGILILYGVSCAIAQETNPNKICTDKMDRDACNVIIRTQEYDCLNTITKTDCVLNIDQGKPQFTILEPEEALLAAPFVSENVVVIGEVSSRTYSSYETVVLARNFYNNSLENLRGKRYCHPGFTHDELITRYVLEELESRILKLNSSYCDNSESTLLEKQIGALSNFFGSGCRPGAWVYDDDATDQNFKGKYSNLCELCGSEKCNVKYQDPFKGALDCLSNGGDVAVTSLSKAQEFLNSSSTADLYRYICPNGTATSSDNPCTWTKQLNRLIITHKDVSNKPKVYLETNLPEYFSPNPSVVNPISSSLGLSLEIILGLRKEEIIESIEPVSLSTYVAARRIIPSFDNNTYCKEMVNWCTLTDLEQHKCQWLSQASLNTGLQPAIQCVQSSDNDTISCLNQLQNGEADLMFADVTYGYTALKKNLTSVAYPETYLKDLATILIVVRNNTTNISSLRDLKEKSGCFPQYAGREWLAFIDTLRTQKIVTSCDYSQLFSDFVGDSCVPGAREPEFNADAKDKLCQKCLPVFNVGTAKYCNADELNKYYGTDGALRCLKNNDGDYAVITIKDIKEFHNDTNWLRILSPQGQVASEPGLNGSNDLSLTIITSGELVVKNTSVRRENIIQLLKGIELEFGQNLRKIFKVFEIFNHTRNLLFPDSTPGLTFDGTESVKWVDNFKTLLRNSEQCMQEPSSVGNSAVPSTILMVIFMLMLRF